MIRVWISSVPQRLEGNVLQLIAMSTLVLALGLAFLLTGYRLFRILLPIWAFFVGLWLGAQVTALLLNQAFLDSAVGWIAGIAVGFVLAALSYLFFAIGVVLLGASFGAWFGTSMMLLIGYSSGFLASMATIITAIIFAGLTVFLDIKKHLIIAITSFVGSSAIITGLLLISGAETMKSVQLDGNFLRPILDTSAFWLIVWLLVAAAGVAIQERTTRGFFLEMDQQLSDES
jgi:Domain of unknown function (DUF4203)